MKKLISLLALTGLMVSALWIVTPIQAINPGKVIYATGFEYGSNIVNDTIFWLGGSVNNAISGYTSQPSEVIDGSRSYKYALNVQNGWNDLGGSDAGKLTMSAQKTYTVAFRFKKTDISEFTVKLEEMNIWATIYELYFNADTMQRLGGVNSTTDYNLTTMGDYKYVQFSFTAPLTNNCYFKFAAKGNGANPAVILEDFYVYEGAMPATDNPGAQQTLFSEHFENGFNTFTPFVVPTLSFQSCSFITNKSDEVINQSGSVFGKFNYPAEGTQWCAYMNTKDGMINLEAMSTYTVQFRYRIVTPAQNFFYLVIKNTNYLMDRYVGFNTSGIDQSFLGGVVNASIAQDGDFKILTATFTTMDATGYNLLQFGSNGGGSILFDDISLYKGLDTTTLQPAVYSAPAAATKIFTETFEDGFTYFNPFITNDISTQTFSTITRDNTRVINGTRSSYGAWNYPSEGTEWGAFLKTKPNVVTFDSNTNYTVKFRYKILRNAGSFFYVIFDNEDPQKSQYLGFNSNGADFSFASGVSQYKFESDGDFKTLTIVFSTASTNVGYKSFDFGAKGGGEIVFDDISISKGIGTTVYPAAVYQAPVMKFRFGNEFNKDITGSNFWISTTTDSGTEIVTNSNKIAGSASYMLFAKNTTAWADILYSDLLKPGAAFKANTRYTVTFKYKKATKTLCENLSTGNFYFSLKPNDGDASFDYHLYQGFDANGKVLYINGANTLWRNGIEEFIIKDNGSGYYDASISFKTMNREDYRIVFGVMNGGAIIIDDINVYEWNGSDTTNPVNPVTADSTNPLQVYSLILICAAVATVVSLRKKAIQE